MLHARYRVRVSLHRGVGEEKLACSLLTYPAPAAVAIAAPIPVSRDRGRPTRCNLYFCVQPTRIREMKGVTKVLGRYFSLCCPAEKEKKPSFGGLEQEAGMNVPTRRAAVFTVFFRESDYLEPAAAVKWTAPGIG